jgi:integrase
VRAVHLERGSPVLGASLKTAGARRTLAIPADVAAMLQVQVGTDSPSASLLFTAPNGGPVWPSTVRSELADACTKAKVPKVTPNELRHTAATHMSARLAPHQIADVLGHTTSRMVDETYRHRPAVIRGAD